MAGYSLFSSWVPSGLTGSPLMVRGGCSLWWLWHPLFTDMTSFVYWWDKRYFHAIQYQMILLWITRRGTYNLGSHSILTKEQQVCRSEARWKEKNFEFLRQKIEGRQIHKIAKGRWELVSVDCFVAFSGQTKVLLCLLVEKEGRHLHKFISCFS